MKTILVSGASGIVGYGILRSLRASGIPLRLIGTSIHLDSVAPGFCDVFEAAPPTNDPRYEDWLLETVAKHKVDLLVPGIEIDMYAWTGYAPKIVARGAKVLLNDFALIELCRDKWIFYEDLIAANIPCAIESTLIDDFDVLMSKFGLPFLLKPRSGFGSKGIVRVESREMFLQHRAAMGARLMAQPIVGNDDEEFTTSAFCDGAGGHFACMTLRRKLSRDGFTEKAEVVETGEFLEAISMLSRRYRPIGPTNFQFRTYAAGVKLLEINPRISSSTSIRAAFGYNESAMAVEYFLEHKQPLQPFITRGRAVRYTEDFIFHDDRTHLGYSR